ncbi:hypothetical protein OJ996_07250 [Luteolibacter sp. GHJ8]|uniref:Lipoprotein n=1 Tax=Luteolibacter rhizosphaerae TaxID=2989719 RepID=A0ABT3G0K7_9BACT|nr:hypothetical protein [Luteolibacter rhizosphaerae]MCW1913362.1 hypothetical protein [Luteolibacter rhizosphaerae]
MRKLAIGTLLGASLALSSCGEKSKTEGGGAATAEEAKSQSHVLAGKGGKIPAKGVTHTVESSGDMKEAKMKIEAAGQTMEGSMTRSESSVEKWEHVADNKARRTLESKTVGGAMNVAGQDQPIPEEKDALVGVPVIVELKDGKYAASLESGTATSEQTKALEKLAETVEKDSDFGMYGDAPRKVGDKWDVDPKSLGAFGEASDLSGTYSIEFVEVKDFQGTPCAVLKSVFDISGKTEAEGEGEPAMTVKIKGEAISHRSLADKTDLDAKITSTMTMEGSPAPQVKMNVEGPFNLHQKATVKKN